LPELAGLADSAGLGLPPFELLELQPTTESAMASANGKRALKSMRKRSYRDRTSAVKSVIQRPVFSTLKMEIWEVYDDEWCNGAA
jgi:hypothetical protein